MFVPTSGMHEILVRTYELMKRNSEEMLRNPSYNVNALLIYICRQGTHISEELRMAVTAALQAMGGNVVMPKQLCGRECMWGSASHSPWLPYSSGCTM